MRVLLAEDDPGLRAVIQRGLQEAGYRVDAAADGESALSFLRTYSYAAAVVDWRMPKLSGLELVEWARRNALSTPVLMLTARDAMRDRVTGLDAGADDYLVKPFEFAELLARLRALLRRPATSQAPNPVCGDIELDLVGREARVSGRGVALTATEFGILELLLRRQPAVVERRDMALHVWPEEADALGSNTIDVHMARLRSKLSGSRTRIETVRGVGYRVVAG